MAQPSALVAPDDAIERAVAVLCDAAPHLLAIEAPFLGECPRCRREVLAVDMLGREVVVEPAETIPSAICPQCRQVHLRGHHRDPACPRCRGTGRIGSALPLSGVALHACGRARWWRRGDVLYASEVVMRLHAC